MKLLKFLVVCVFLEVQVCKASPSAIETDAVFNHCCNLMEKLPFNNLKCDQVANFKSIENVLQEHQDLCKKSLKLCCHRSRLEKDCEEGKLMAQGKQNCNVENRSEHFKLCCLKCSVGQEIGKANGKCNYQSHDSIIQECCERINPDLSFAEGPISSTVQYDHSTTDEFEEPTEDYVATICPLHSCEHDCEMRDGKPECFCFIGYKLAKNGISCNSICGTGFEFKENSGECEDINECISGSPCEPSDRCVNSIGSYNCEPKSCDQGYQLNEDSGECDDIDECDYDYICQKSETCINLEGSYFCEPKQCVQGYKLNKESKECEDINECESEVSCPVSTKCVNTNGAYSCELKTCPRGFKLNQETGECDDVNECDYENNCYTDEICVNSVGSYSCKRKTCNRGYQLDQYSGNCEDIDECLRSSCRRNEKCVNYPGSFSCECNDGYERDKRSQRCLDINECKVHPGICQQKCQNSIGSYRCSCNKGFRLNNDKRTCADIDECEIDDAKSLCASPAFCKNTLGSYKCSCPAGFLPLHQRHCEDIDECSNNPNICSKQRCLNIRGSYKCISKPPCDDGYSRTRGYCLLRNFLKCHEGNEIEDNEIDRGCKIPLTYDHTSGTIGGKCFLPKEGRKIYRFQLARKRIYDFSLKKLKVNSAGKGVRHADESYFDFETTPTEIGMSQMMPIDGPQEIEIEFWIQFYGTDNRTDNIEGHRMTIYVSKY